jgi:hypothetical protein
MLQLNLKQKIHKHPTPLFKYPNKKGQRRCVALSVVDSTENATSSYAGVAPELLL